VLVFGCRSAKSDFYYNQEWTKLEAEHDNFKVLTAFSRDNEDGSKDYVQHVIKRNRELLGELIVKQDAVIYVSGRAKLMPTSVEKAFVEVIKNTIESKSEADAQVIIK